MTLDACDDTFQFAVTAQAVHAFFAAETGFSIAAERHFNAACEIFIDKDLSGIDIAGKTQGVDDIV